MQVETTFLQEQLQQNFGYSSFRRGQAEIIRDILAGKNVLGILPTGSGKSICYQLPAKLLNGTTIVVSPLISLMIDQVKQLKAKQFKQVTAINSFMNREMRNSVLRKLHTYRLIYVSPELLQQQYVQGRLRNLKVSLFVIDEAHCISQWGHEFRPDYLKLQEVIMACKSPPVLALSATATPKVQEDIIYALGGKEFVKHIYPMDRPNIAFSVEQVENEDEKLVIMKRLFSQYRVPSLVYFSSRQAAEEVAQELASSLDLRIAVYHGGMEQQDRITIQQQFMNDQLDIICCTSAFGMGINKSNIHLVIHYHLTTQLEAYIQEIGRAGRDGEASVSLLLYSNKDIQLPKHIISRERPSKQELVFVFNKLKVLDDADKPLPIKEEEVVNCFDINEVQWRFIKYHLENHGIIKHNSIHFQQETWDHAFKQIYTYIEKRTMIKQAKLAEIIDWIYQQDCLRKHLYKGFQSSYQPPVFQCCSNCGFSWKDWQPQQTRRKGNTYSWQEQLKNKLLIGGANETT